MIDSKEKYRRKKMFREFVAEHEKKNKSQKKFNAVFLIVVGIGAGLIAFSTLATTVTVVTTLLGV